MNAPAKIVPHIVARDAFVERMDAMPSRRRPTIGLLNFLEAWSRCPECVAAADENYARTQEVFDKARDKALIELGYKDAPTEESERAARLKAHIPVIQDGRA